MSGLSPLPSPDELAAMIDHTFLKAYGPPQDIERLCDEARRYGFAMVAVNPAETERCAALLAGSPVRVGAAVGFPLGQCTPETKSFEISDAIGKGAGEIDMVINIRALQAGNTGLVREEIREMVRICRLHEIISKVILETCYLSDHEKRTVCRISAEEGADFVKTSTGFGQAGATVRDITLMRETVAGACRIKAAGGIRDLSTALAMITAGAARIGTSGGVAIIEELRNTLKGETHRSGLP